MNLLFLTDGLSPFVTGGMQQHSVMLAKHLAPLVQKITLIHCGPVNGEVPNKTAVLKELGNPENVEVIGIPFEDTGKLPGHYLRASMRLSQRFFDAVGDLSQFDAIYAQGLTGNAFLGKHPKLMVNLHGLEMFQPAFSWKERVGKMLLKSTFRKQIKFAWRNVSLGGRLSDILLEQGASKESIVEIPNGIESKWVLSEAELSARFQRREGRSPRFVMIGRNEFRKGLHVLQVAMAELSDPIELHMIGDWPQWDAGIHSVINHGVVRDKMTLFSILDECDVLLLPSLSEGMPTVILEAAARGLPTIASDVGAVRKIVPHENVVEPGRSNNLREIIAKVNSDGLTGIQPPITFEDVASKTYNNLFQ